MLKPDVVRVTADQNPEFIKELEKMRIGESGKAEIRFTKKAQDAEGADLTVEAYVPEGYEIDDDQTEPNLVGPVIGNQDAMMTPAAMMVRKRVKKVEPAV